MPAYSHATPNSIRTRLDRIRALRQQVFYTYPGSTYNTGYWNTGYWGSGYWGGNFWGPGMYFGAGYFCDPFDYLNAYNLYGFPYGFAGTANAFYLDGGLYTGYGCLYPGPFGGLFPFYGSPSFGYPYSSGLLYNSPLSFGALCPLCTTSTLDFSLFALDNPYLAGPWRTPYGSSTGLTAGGTLSSTAAALASSTDNASLTPGLFSASLPASGASRPATAIHSKIPASMQPVSLVFTDGTAVQATKYWLGNGKMHYVTTSGVSQSVPLSRFDLQATMRANQQDGVQFLPPSTPPKQEPKQP